MIVGSSRWFQNENLIPLRPGAAETVNDEAIHIELETRTQTFNQENSTKITRMRAFLIILFAALTGVAGWFVGTRFGPSQSPASGPHQSLADEFSAVPDSNLGQRKFIRCQGKLEPASGLIKIVAPPGERVARLSEKQVGETVAKDEILLVLQSRKLREKDLALANARLKDAIQQIEFEKGQGSYKLASAELAVAEADASDEKIASEAKKINLLKRQLVAARELLDRLQKIQSNPVTTDLVNQTDIDKQILMVEQLNLQIEQADLEIDLSQKSANRGKEVAKNNFLTVRDSLANAEKATPLSTLRAAVELAQHALEMTEIKSPIDNATILDIIVREGNSVTNQPVMILGDTSEMICVAEVNDLFLRKIDLVRHPDLRARITSSAWDQPLTGRVVEKGIMIGPPSLKDPNPFASVDRRTGTVTIMLDDAELAAKFVNLQVDVEIEIEPDSLPK